MANDLPEKDTPLLRHEATVALLVLRSGVSKLPARPWPLVAACQTLANELPRTSPFLTTAKDGSSNLTGTREVESWLHRLAATSAFRVAGRGMHAAWVPDARWLAQWSDVADTLEASEVEAWAAAGQALANCVSIWRNAASAASSSVSPSH